MKRLTTILSVLLFLLPCAAFANQATFSSYATGISANYSPNQLYLNKFLGAVAKENKNNPELPAIENKIRQDLSTTTDMVWLFMKDNQAKLKSPTKTTASNGFFDGIALFLSSIFEPKQALATVATLPFGGPLDSAEYCDCSDSWLIYIGPTSNPATSDEVLSYEEGTQAFEYYNIPFATELLGDDEPGVQGCYEYIGYGCTVIGSEGEITPIVGSNI